MPGDDTTLTVNVPCPDCGELSVEPVQRVVDNDVIPCSLCGGLIDLADESCRNAVAEARRVASLGGRARDP